MQNVKVMVQFAPIDEAWQGCGPPTRYAPQSEPFDIARFDSGSGESHASIAPHGESAHESAYPYDRMYGTRSTHTLDGHAERGTDRLGPGEAAPRPMYAAPHAGSSDTAPPPVSRVWAAERPSEKQRCMYDLLVFFLFGLLAVLVLHEVAVMGESIGAERVAALAAGFSR